MVEDVLLIEHKDFSGLSSANKEKIAEIKMFSVDVEMATKQGLF